MTQPTTLKVVTSSSRLATHTRWRWLKHSIPVRVWRLNKLAAVAGLFILFIGFVALFPSVIAGQDPLQQNLTARFESPSSSHWFGTDHVGRDVYSRVVYGTRMSVAAGVFSVLFSTTIGVCLGLISGFFGGRLDTILMRFLEIMLAFPGVLLALLIVATLGPGLRNVIIALVVFSVPEMARVVRAQVLGLREEDYILAARSIGAQSARIMFVHLLPNTVSAIVVVATLRVGVNILVAASLSFLGLGVQLPTPEWGLMVADGRNYLRAASHLITFPGLAILVTVLAINFFGDAVNQVTNPRMRRS
jgi:peptide/nickel transport system permease protein